METDAGSRDAVSVSAITGVQQVGLDFTAMIL
jgi:hypothetical protein